MSQQCALVTRKATRLLGCTGQCAASRLRDGILHLCSVLVRHSVEFWDQCLAPQCKRDIDILDPVQ